MFRSYAKLIFVRLKTNEERRLHSVAVQLWKGRSRAIGSRQQAAMIGRVGKESEHWTDTQTKRRQLWSSSPMKCITGDVSSTLSSDHLAVVAPCVPARAHTFNSFFFLLLFFYFSTSSHCSPLSDLFALEKTFLNCLMSKSLVFPWVISAYDPGTVAKYTYLTLCTHGDHWIIGITNGKQMNRWNAEEWLWFMHDSCQCQCEMDGQKWWLMLRASYNIKFKV